MTIAIAIQIATTIREYVLCYLDVKCYLIEREESGLRMRLRRAAMQAQTRERLLDSARRAVALSGAAASVRDIAEAAGYSQGALYANFGSKEGLLLELMRRHMQSQADTLSTIVGKARDGETALAMLARWASTLNADADWAALAIELEIYSRRSTTFAAEYSLTKEAHQRALGDLLTKLFAMLKLLPPADPLILSGGLIALAHGLSVGGKNAVGSAGATIMIFVSALIKSATPERSLPMS